MTTLMVDDEVVSRLEAVAAPEEDVAALAKTAMIQFIERRERQAAGHAEMQAMLDGPRRSHEASMAEMRRKYDIPDLRHLTNEELVEQTEAYLATLPLEKIAEAERLGLL